MPKSFGVSPITGQIFMGTSKPVESDPHARVWIGDKQDVTDEVIKAVFEWFMFQAKDSGRHSIRYGRLGDLTYTAHIEEAK